MAYAQKLASRAPLPQQFAKEVIYRSHGLPLDEALRIESQSFRALADTEDLAEGNLSFRERRNAEFKGR
jgi:enoyl-CoA hydratase/carnithine racemase